MAQVTRSTNDVIVNSLYLLGELGIGEEPDGFMLTTGLDLINELLDKFAADSIYIPYLTTIDHQFIVGKATYSISDMILGTDITADRVVDLSFANYLVPAAGINQGNPVTLNFTANSTTNYLTISSSSLFPTGTPVTINTFGTIPSPLIAGVTYYTIFVNATTLMLARTEQDALLGVPILLLSNGVPINTITTYQGVFFPENTAIDYPIRIISKAEYYGVVRQIGLLARPGFMFLDKQATESFVTVYPAPDQPYHFSLKMKVMINSLDAQDDLTELPPFYYGFLKYALARKFLGYYPSGNWPKENEDEYQDYYAVLKAANETDLTIRPSVILTAPEPFYWPNILSY